MLSVSETTRRLIVATFLLAANKVLQSYARNLRSTSRSIVLRMTGVLKIRLKVRKHKKSPAAIPDFFGLKPYRF